MKKTTKNTLIGILCCGLLATASLGAMAGVKAFAATERVKPTGANTETLTQEINDADLDTFQVYGASTRKKAPNGFRFLTTIEDSDLALIPNDAEFGAIIIPNSMLSGELTVDTANALVAPAKVDTEAEEVPANGIGYYISLVGETLENAFPENLYGTVLAARAYVKYTYQSNGETVTDYAYSKETIYRSISYVASCELAYLENSGNADADSNSFLNKIIAQTTTGAVLTLSNASLKAGERATAILTGATDGVNNFAYTLSSSNQDVAIITDGEIEAIGAGTTEITATIGARKISATLTVKGAIPFEGGNILYSTNDSTIFMPDGLLDSDEETIISAIDAEGNDYFNRGKWTSLALTEAEIKANTAKETALTVETSDGDMYIVNAISYAGVIDELKDFETFFSTDHDTTVYPPPTYGYYIIVKNMGALTDDLSITCSAIPSYNAGKIAGFNGIVDGLGHTVKFNLRKGGLFGSILGNCTIQNLAVEFNDNTAGHYGVFGYRTDQNPQIINCYIRQHNNHYQKTSTYGLMYQPYEKLILKNTVIFGNCFTMGNNSGRSYISADSENAFVIWGTSGADATIKTNFTEVSTNGTITHAGLAELDSNYWTTTDNKPNWKTASDLAVSLYDKEYVEVLEENALYSTRDGEMFLPDFLADGETVADAYDTNGVDYYQDGVWSNLAVNYSTANETKDTAIMIKTSNGYLYALTVSSYAGVIDELDDFKTFFDNDTTANAPVMYGYYIVSKDLGDGTDELALTQTTMTDYSRTSGFNGVLDGQGHTLRFKLMSGGLVGMVLGNAVIKNLGVIFEDATSTKYGVFGYITNGAPEIRNCYIEQTNNHFGRTTVYGLMGSPNNKLRLHNTVVYGYNVSLVNASSTTLNETSSNAYVIHARSEADTWKISTNFTKVFNDGLADGSREVLLSEIADASGFDSNYWYKENGKLIWKGLDVVNITWINGNQTTVEPFTKGDVMQFPTLDEGYWSKTENGEQATVKDVKPTEDCTYYVVSTNKYVDENAMYSTKNNEFFLPTEITNSINNPNAMTITSADGETTYFADGEWVRNFALSAAQIQANETLETEIKVSDGVNNYYVTVVSYAGVIDEFSDLNTFFDTKKEGVAADAQVDTYGYYVLAKNLVDVDTVVTMNHTTGYSYAGKGFMGVLDGMGHTLSCTLKGYLLGNELGNCLIKDIALKIQLRAAGEAEMTGQVGVLADLCFAGRATPTIENTYFEILGEVPRYNGLSTWFIMARSNGNLVLNNVVIHGNHMTGAQASTVYQVSGSSSNVFVVYARSAMVTAGQATNFDEVSTNGALTSDLSVLDSNYWTTTDNKPNWKTASDLSLQSLGMVEVAQKMLAESGATEYAIIMPSNASSNDNMLLAQSELIYFFEEATGATLSIAQDGEHSTYDAYISIGYTDMYKASGLSLGGITRQGYQIQTKNNAIFINSAGTLGCLYGVYGLLNELFGYEQFSNDCYTLNKITEVECPVGWDILDVPDFEKRVAVSGSVTNDATYAARMRMVSTKYLLPVGDTANNGGIWRDNHNTLEILPPSYWQATKPNWYSDVKINGSINQICYTAHGNATDYAEMVAQIGKVLCEITIKNDGALSKDKNPEAEYIVLSSEDGNGVCTCSACRTAKSTYGSDAGAVLKLCNDVRTYIDNWMDANPRYQRDITLLLLAYNDYFEAPVTLNSTSGKYELKGGLTINDGVGIYLAGSSYANYYYDINDAKNADFKVALQKWADVTNASNAPLGLWTYSLNNAEYMIHSDMYGANTFYNENAYQFFADLGVDMYYNQGPWNATTTVTAFNRLNIYLDSQLQWDSAQSVTTLTDKYFKAMYGAGATYMSNLYQAENAASRKLFNIDVEGVPNQFMDSWSLFTAFYGALSQTELNTWVGYITSAKNAVNLDQSLTEEQKAAYIARINEEWIAVKYWQMNDSRNSWNSSAKATAKEEFRAVLGYDASTGTYAKDVTIGERYTYTLKQWIEKGFSAP